MKKKYPLFISFILIFSLLGYLLFSFFNHEKALVSRVNELESKISLLEAQQIEYAKQLENEEAEKSQLQTDINDMILEMQLLKNQMVGVEYLNNGFNYLAIGNSITKHQICSYWWDEIGMGATSKDKDYVHLVEKYLLTKNDAVQIQAVNFSNWELQGFDRVETLFEIDSYLSSKLDLVTIQLSECVWETSTFKSDYIELIELIKKKAPEARIIMIDDFWDEGEKAEILREVSSEEGVQFVDLSEIKNIKEYMCGLNTVVLDADGNEHVVTHEGVATHPGNLGMQYYADKIIDALE